MAKTKLLLASRVAEQIGIPVRKWEGSCYAIACAMLEHKLVKGEPRYGHWLGPIASGTVFDRDSFVTHHGWIQTKEIIVDPTRWVFEGKPPYIYQAPDFEGWYDAVGKTFRELRVQPFPDYDPKAGAYELSPRVRQALLRLTGVNVRFACRLRLHWLVTQSLGRLGLDAGPIFRWMIQQKLGALIPIDNRQLVLGQSLAPSSRR